MELIRAKKPKLSIDLAPLIDVVFQLLVFFMLTSTFANPAIKMVLPKAVSADQIDQEKIVISIDEQGDLFLNDQITSIDSFKVDLQKQLSAQNLNAVHIKGHQDMPYKYFVKIMDLARQAGATQVNIVHQKGQ